MMLSVAAMAAAGIAAWGSDGRSATAGRGCNGNATASARRGDWSSGSSATIGRGLTATTALGGMTSADAIEQTDAIATVTTGVAGIAARSWSGRADAADGGRDHAWCGGDVPAQSG
jgi:hypothetical protein